jgi:hypothetical protein
VSIDQIVLDQRLPELTAGIDQDFAVEFPLELRDLGGGLAGWVDRTGCGVHRPGASTTAGALQQFDLSGPIAIQWAGPDW